jgi:hypothetical protein
LMSFVVSNCAHSRVPKINEQADFGLMTHILPSRYSSHAGFFTVA